MVSFEIKRGSAALIPAIQSESNTTLKKKKKAVDPVGGGRGGGGRGVGGVGWGGLSGRNRIMRPNVRL